MVKMVIPVTDDLDLFIQDILKYLTKKATDSPETDKGLFVLAQGLPV